MEIRTAYRPLISRPEVHSDWRRKAWFGEKVLMFIDVELAAKNGGSVVVSLVLDVVLVERSSKVNF